MLLLLPKRDRYGTYNNTKDINLIFFHLANELPADVQHQTRHKYAPNNNGLVHRVPSFGDEHDAVADPEEVQYVQDLAVSALYFEGWDDGCMAEAQAA